MQERQKLESSLSKSYNALPASPTTHRHDHTGLLLPSTAFPKNVNLSRTIICPTNINGQQYAFHITGWIHPNEQQAHNPSFHAPTGTETRGIAVPLYPPPPADEELLRCDENGTVNF